MVSWVQDLSGVSAMMLQPPSAPSSSEHLGLRGCGASQAPEPHLTTFGSGCPFPQPATFLLLPLLPGPQAAASSPLPFRRFSLLRGGLLRVGRELLPSAVVWACPSTWPATEPSHPLSLGVSLCVVCPRFPRPELKAAFSWFWGSQNLQGELIPESA